MASIDDNLVTSHPGKHQLEWIRTD